MNRPSESLPAAITIASTTQASASAAFKSGCSRPGSMIGLPGMISWSFPKAMFEPQNETEPMIAANRIGIRCFELRSPPKCRNSAHEISATAPPPTPLNSATICGIAVIFTLRAAGIPTAVPIATPSTIRPHLPMPGRSSVSATAIAMPVAATMLPLRAVAGLVMNWRPTMNIEKATM